MLINFFTGKKVLKTEWSGFGFVVLGCTVLLSDPTASRAGGDLDTQTILLADLINFLSCIGGALYFLM